MNDTPRPATGRRPLMLLLLVQGVSGVAGGLGLVADPSGAALGLPREWLRGSPFTDYLWPGLILLLGLGACPLVVAHEVRACRPWARPASFLVGVALVVWIAVQVAIVGFHPRPPLQPIYGALGLAIAVTALLPTWHRGRGRGRP